MLAVIYLIFMLLSGNLICQRFYRFVSLPHRLAANFLVGFLFSTWATYLFALAFERTQSPLLWGNLIFFAASSLFIFWFYKRDSVKFSEIWSLDNSNTDKWDWVFTGIVFLISCWLMFGSFGLSGGKMLCDSIVWNDFGPNISLVQSFAVGHNFPTEYPHFIGEPIRYHFLFWFQAGNLEFLGLNIAWSLNVLSVLTMTAMLVLVMILGQVIFNSKAVGRIAAILFFFFGTLSYIPFLFSQDSIADAFHTVVNMHEWLKSIYTYSGEQWGVWSLGTFMAQRHLPTSIGILLVVFIFLLQQIKEKSGLVKGSQINAPSNSETSQTVETEPKNTLEFTPQTVDNTGDLPSPNTERNHFNRVFWAYIFSGLIIGLLPLWNSAVYVSACAVVAGLLLVFPNRLNTLYLLIVSAIFAVPQILFLRASESKELSEIIHWGYVVDPPTILNVLKYFAFTFGLKTLLALCAVAVLSAFHRRLFVALLGLPILAFGTKLSTDIMNNHKFLYVWMTVINLFAAYALWRLWKSSIVGKVAAALLIIAVTLGGTIEFFRIYNDNTVEVPFSGGQLYDWLYSETKPGDLFLTPKFVHHPILLSGRRIFYGSSYFGWSMGYPAPKRDVIYKQMYEEKNVTELIRLLNENNIKYIVYDDDLRNGEFKDTLNEAVSEAYFQKVFVDKENKYNSLVIYKVPQK